MLKHYDDGVDSILKLNPGNYRQTLLGGVMKQGDDVDIHSPKRPELALLEKITGKVGADRDLGYPEAVPKPKIEEEKKL